MMEQNRIPADRGGRKEMSGQKNPGNHLQITGFNLYTVDKGKNILSIKADEFSIEKKKMGFFRFGLLNVAYFKNATIDVYLRRTNALADTGLMVDALPSIENALPSLKEALPSSSSKRIQSIVIEPVCLNLWNEQSLLTRITSTSATVGMKERNIMFQGGVFVESGDKSLVAENLYFIYEKAVMKTDCHYILSTPTEKTEGDHITTDLILNVTSIQDSF